MFNVLPMLLGLKHINCFWRNKTSAEIAKSLGIVEDDTHAQTRALILECAEKYELPLAANNRGYYLISDQQEYEEYMANLDSRSAGIEQRKRIITKNYRGTK